MRARMKEATQKREKRITSPLVRYYNCWTFFTVLGFGVSSRAKSSENVIFSFCVGSVKPMWGRGSSLGRLKKIPLVGVLCLLGEEKSSGVWLPFEENCCCAWVWWCIGMADTTSWIKQCARCAMWWSSQKLSGVLIWFLDRTKRSVWMFLYVCLAVGLSAITKLIHWEGTSMSSDVVNRNQPCCSWWEVLTNFAAFFINWITYQCFERVPKEKAVVSSSKEKFFLFTEKKLSIKILKEL